MKHARGFSLLVLCLLTLELLSQSAVCSYKYRKRISFNPAQVSGSTDLANFPALISITSDNDLRTVANLGHVENASGFDIIFTSDDGVTKLDHQLEKYTASTGELVAWVRVPVLSTTYSTTIYMYYGNTAIGSNQSVTGTWNADYEGVWHLNNNVFTDGTSNSNNATNGGSTNLASAKIAGGRTFPGTGTNYIQTPLNGMTSNNGSISFWGRVTTYAASTYFFGETTNQGGGYTNRIQLYTGDASGNLYLGMGGNHTQQSNIQTMALNTWYHIALTWNATTGGNGTYWIYVNGVQQGTGAYSGYNAIHTFGDLGNDGNAGQRTEEITGDMDEVHANSTTLSSGWILTEYNNQNSPSTFYSVWAEPKVWNGGTSIAYATASNWLGSSVPASGDDVILNNGTFQPTLGGNIQVKSMFIRTNATLSLGANTLSAYTDITNCGVIAGNTGMVTLNSTTAHVQMQNLSGSGTFSLNHLTINNTFTTSPAALLNRSVAVNGTLTLSSGIVYTSATNILAIGIGAASTSGSANSFVSGPISKTGATNFVFPTGKGTSWRRIGLSGISASATFRGEYFNSAYTSTTPVTSPLTDVSVLEYWQMDLISGAANASLTLYWENAGASGINNCADLTIARWGGASWAERAATTVAGSGCASTGTGTITTNALVTAFSPFTFGSKSTIVNPLPIELKEFKAKCADNTVSLIWTTGTEKNNAYFLLERSSDGDTWTDLHHTTGAGNSMVSKSYGYTDTDPMEGLAYYRLSQADLDGSIKVYKTVTASCLTGTDYLKIYPNPSANEFYAEIYLSQSYGEALLKITDALGKTCLEQVLNTGRGKYTARIAHRLPPGSYALQVSYPAMVLPVQKLIIK
jgi:hypothetical protein